MISGFLVSIIRIMQCKIDIPDMFYTKSSVMKLCYFVVFVSRRITGSLFYLLLPCGLFVCFVYFKNKISCKKEV